MRTTLILYLSISLLLTACDKPLSDVASAQQAPSVLPSELKVLGSESALNERKTYTWKSSPNVVKGQGAFQAVFFLDENHGWAGGDEGNLYKTVDGGASWQQAKVEVLAGATVKNIFFINAVVGWIVLQKRVPNIIAYDEGYFRLMQTRDGGRSWQVQYEAKGTEVTNLYFTSEQTGWLTGVQFIGKSPVRYSYLILHTTDQGQHWEDASVELKRLVSRQTNRHPDELNDGVMGITSIAPSTTAVITSEMEIFKTSTGGGSWLEVGSIQNSLARNPPAKSVSPAKWAVRDHPPVKSAREYSTAKAARPRTTRRRTTRFTPCLSCLCSVVS